MDTSKDILKALDNFDAFQKQHKAGIAGADISVNVCATYLAVKPIIAAILPFLGWIPGVGARIVAAIQVLFSVMDGFCPVVKP